MTAPQNPSTGKPWTPEEYGRAGEATRDYQEGLVLLGSVGSIQPHLRYLASLMPRHSEAVQLLREAKQEVGCLSDSPALLAIYDKIHVFLAREDAG